ncbi:BQ5605_C001g00180 [Microbotryum silenes-dioicae]|uniref:BQ5605_C001g00180 protein n=1 Tax=Microbotryum silenes-dioicae TaxID=796604 RepID=A0A2X0M2J1_9BASI|nr:BQ5605_C001g00180 [Microbotryum silenes-dioicae]
MRLMALNGRDTHFTTLSSLASLRSEISRIAVEGTPSSSASRRIFFNATISPVSLLRDRY